MTDIDQFDKIIKELHSLKPPGVSGSRIKAINNIAIKNVSQESLLIPKLYSGCRQSPSSNKLGMLYVVDIILRSYNEEAKKLNEEINGDSKDGTFASGVYKISELIETILDDALEFTIDKVTINKISKLMEVWERTKSLDSDLLKKLKSKYFKSSTPPGSPPPRITELNLETKETENSNSSTSNTITSSKSASILLALDNLQKLSSKSPTPVNQPITTNNNDANTNSILSQLSNLSGNVVSNASPSTTKAETVANPAANNVLNMLQGFQNNNTSNNNSYSRRDRSPTREEHQVRERTPPRRKGLPASLPSIPKSLPAIPRKVSNDSNKAQEPYEAPQVSQNSQQLQHPPSNENQFQSNNFQQQGLNEPKIPPSVDVNGVEEFNVEGNPHYRPRNIGIDQSIGNGSIKVFSRTLFFGGVTRDVNEQSLIEILRPFAEVQSIILNVERKHAFVKVYSRREAENIVNSFNQDNSLPLRIRWGVGFGPRDCCNYQLGVSIIPITRLTESDKTWLENAQWGGTGGQPITSGLVIDEPDIEASTGVSSKSISKKMPTNSARNGPKSGADPYDYNNFNNFNNNNNQLDYGSKFQDTNNNFPPSNGIPPSSGNPNLAALSSFLNQQK